MFLVVYYFPKRIHSSTELHDPVDYFGKRSVRLCDLSGNQIRSHAVNFDFQRNACVLFDFSDMSISSDSNLDGV